MPMYNCEACEYITDHRASYDKHIHSKKHFIISKNVPKHAISCQNVPNHAISCQNVPNHAISCQTVVPTLEFVCKYCGKSYKHKCSLNKHIRYNCDKNTDEDLKELVRLMNKKIEKQSREMELQRKQIESQNKHIEKLMSKLQMNNTVNSNNNINNTVNNIKILAYKDTDLSHLTDNDYAFCIKQVNFCVKSMIEKVHFNPNKHENMNIYISNLKDKYLMVYEDANWNIKTKKELDYLYEKNEMLLEEWLDEEQHKYPELKEKFERYLENKEKDETLNMIKDEIKMMMYNKRST